MSTVNSVAMHEATFTHKSLSNQAITNLNAKICEGNDWNDWISSAKIWQTMANLTAPLHFFENPIYNKLILHITGTLHILSLQIKLRENIYY